MSETFQAHKELFGEEQHSCPTDEKGGYSVTVSEGNDIGTGMVFFTHIRRWEY